MTPHHLHATAAAWSLHTARLRLAELAREEAARNIWAEQLPAAPILRAPTYGTRHATGGHSDPVSGLLAVEEPPARDVTWTIRQDIADRRLNGIARMFGIAQTHTLARIRHAIPQMLPATARLMAKHLQDEDALIRSRDWLDLPPAREPLPGVACPHCGERQLYVQTAGPVDVWTVICATGRPCLGHGCRCGMPGAVEGVAHIWDTGTWRRAAPGDTPGELIPEHGPIYPIVCCDLHNTHCEPPGDLCCHGCSEAAHPDHRPGEQCVLGAVAGAAQTTTTN